MLRSLLIALLLIAAVANAAPFSFAVLGDAPYNRGERVQFDAMLADLAKEPLVFAVHIGDFKSGYGDCSDAIFADRLQMLDASPIPLVYTPGDNDWTDCNRRMAGQFGPEERLAKLRHVFFGTSRSLGRHAIALDSQSAVPEVCCVENRRWWHEGLVFVTLHVVGPDNNRGTADPPNAEYVARDAATIAWLRAGFAQARSHDARAIALFMQADADIAHRPFRRAFASLLEALEQETKAFRKPVLLVHGDSHRFTLDHPWSKQGVPNFTRLETFGSPTVGWVRVRVDPDSAVVFAFEPVKMP